MNAKTIIASIILSIGAAPGIASAAGALIDGAALTRAEVRAELVRAIDAGELNMRGLTSRNESYGSFNASDLAPKPRRADTKVDAASKASGKPIARDKIGG